jgi:hypothetical protein
MKKFFEKYSHMGCLLPFIMGGLFPIVGMFIGIWKLCDGNVGYFIINSLFVPFIFIGLINIIRSFCALIEKDQTNFDFKKYWHFAIYLIISIAGYIAVALTIAQFFPI